MEFETAIGGIEPEHRQQLEVWPPTPLIKLSHGVDVPYKL